MVEGVIFDVDGTLIDSVDLHAQAWQRAFEHFGHEVPFDAVRAQIGKGGDQLLPVFLTGKQLREEGEALEKWRSTLFKKDYLPEARAFPQVRALFERLRRDGRRVALASSAKGDELETYKRLAGIDDLLDAEATSDDAERSKPYPDIFAAALDRLGGLRPAQVIVVGDSPYDALAAKKLGLRTIGLLCGGFAERDLRDAGAAEIHRDPAALLADYAISPLGQSA